MNVLERMIDDRLAKQRQEAVTNDESAQPDAIKYALNSKLVLLVWE